MAWSDLQPAIMAAFARASRLPASAVRRRTDRQDLYPARVVLLEFELELIGVPAAGEEDDQGGIVPLVTGQIEILARAWCWSESHVPDRSAVELARLLLTRAYLPEVTEILAAAEIALVAVERSIPVIESVDGRDMDVQQLAWRLRAPYCELEDGQPDGPSPRPYFDRVGVDDVPSRAVAPAIAPTVVEAAADWRHLWLGTQTDVLRGTAWADDHPDVTHNVAAEVGAGPLVAATSITTASALAASSHRDALSLVGPSSVVLVLRAAAPNPGDSPAALLRRQAAALDGWLLEGLSDGSLRLSLPGTGLSATLAGALDGQWRVVVASVSTGALTLRADVGVASAASVGAYADAYTSLGDGASSLVGLDLALVGDARADDPAALLSAVRAAVGL